MADHPNQGFLARAHKFAFCLSIIYALVIILLAIPSIQRHVLYQHSLRFPWYARFDLPEKYGLAPGKTLNLKVTTSDNVTLGGWFILSEPYYQNLRKTSATPLPAQPSLDVIQDAIDVYPTILFLHGAAATRAVARRIQHYSSFSSRLQTNVFAIDYRGFGDSEGIPSGDGLAEDAYTAWMWLLEQGARASDILVVGHSLGTAVASRLAARLTLEGVKSRVYGHPHSTAAAELCTRPKARQKLVHHEFDTLSIIQEFNVPTLLAHAIDDEEIPHLHSQTLLDRLLDLYLPPVVPLPSSAGITAGARNELVRKIEVPSFGTVEEFDGRAGKVVYVESLWGTHREVGVQEGVQDVIASTFRLGGPK
ncbi:Monoacylglycerol lipase ABHD12 [Grifola frondosa]|uniref:Monoacylglycerol lipase ABHD12 n=1 Tax=Grifola frondosa TaxID=5627 RepID=A0A1C7M8D4_GRIFR|nr:Monoacylglycerol lipase ABHD12 [Grifola frondosa]